MIILLGRVYLSQKHIPMAEFLKISEVNINNIPTVGGKNASLDDMFKSLPRKGKGTNGFVVTAPANGRVWLDRRR